MEDNKIPVKEIGELLDEVTTKVPTLIAGLMKSLYTAEAGKNVGQAVGELYKELIAAGMPNDIAASMAKDYMLSIRELTSSIPMGGGKEPKSEKSSEWKSEE